MQNKQVYNKIGLYGADQGVDLGYIDPTTIETIASVKPSWTKSKNVQFIKKVGDLMFYREKR